MLKVAVDSLEPNLELAKDIFSKDGRLCLVAGAVLSAKKYREIESDEYRIRFFEESNS